MAEIENGLGNPCAGYINEVRERAYAVSYKNMTLPTIRLV